MPPRRRANDLTAVFTNIDGKPVKPVAMKNIEEWERLAREGRESNAFIESMYAALPITAPRRPGDERILSEPDDNDKDAVQKLTEMLEKVKEGADLSGAAREAKKQAKDRVEVRKFIRLVENSKTVGGNDRVDAKRVLLGEYLDPMGEKTEDEIVFLDPQSQRFRTLLKFQKDDTIEGTRINLYDLRDKIKNPGTTNKTRVNQIISMQGFPGYRVRSDNPTQSTNSVRGSMQPATRTRGGPSRAR